MEQFEELAEGDKAELIFVEFDSMEDHFSVEAFEALVCVVLYNFAISQLSLVNRDIPCNFDRSVFSRSFHLLQLSKTLSEKVFDYDRLTELAFNKQAMLVRMLIFRSLALISSYMGMPAESVCYTRLYIDFVGISNQLRSVFSRSTVAASA